MESKLPLMQVQVQDAERPDHDVFVTEESTMGFTQNILGLLYSLATTYEAFSEDGQELPKFYALDEKDHLVEMLRQIRKMAVALDADFDDLVEMSMEN